MDFGKRLKQARLNLGATQEKVATDLHVSRQTISSWENERSYPDINSLIQLSDYYQLSLDILLKEDTGMTEEMQRKEKLSKVFMLSYGLNLLFLIIIILNTFTQLSAFEMGEGVKLLLLVAMLVNVPLLLGIKIEKNNLSGHEKNNTGCLKKYSVIGLLLGGLVLLSAGVLFIMKSIHALYVLGIGVGLFTGSLFIWFFSKYLLKQK